MRRLLSHWSLRSQLLALGLVAPLLIGSAITAPFIFATRLNGLSRWSDALAAAVAGGLGVAVLYWRARHFDLALDQIQGLISRVMQADLNPAERRPMPCPEIARLEATVVEMIGRLRNASHDNERSRISLAERTKTVDRLLDFSQTIQAAGKPEQIFPTLSHFLRSELSLAGMVVLAHEPDALTPVQLRSAWPETLIGGGGVLPEMDAALCPCLRQSQPRHFRSDGAPVRCALDQHLTLSPSYPAYCIPFTIGRKGQFTVHMLLQAGETWTEDRRQLAQTYVNSAQSTLTSLHLLTEAEQQSMTDPLTGLYNRRSLDQLLQREVALAERHDRPLSIVMIDMDHFKQINDTQGHAAGDHLLRSFADCMRMTLRKTDLAFRYGGDEFAVALPQTPIPQAQQVVQKLRQAFSAVDFSSAVPHLENQPTLSVGVAERSAAHHILTLSALLSAADQALYDAKATSRNCVKTYEPPKAA